MLNNVRQKLITYGYDPDDVEYAIVELLQYKSLDSINVTDLKILCRMLERMQVSKADDLRA